MTESRLWVLDRQVFQAIMMTTGIRRQEETMKFLRRCAVKMSPKRLISRQETLHVLGILLIKVHMLSIGSVLDKAGSQSVFKRT